MDFPHSAGAFFFLSLDSIIFFAFCREPASGSDTGSQSRSDSGSDTEEEKHATEAGGDDDLFAGEEADEAKQFMAVKPWKGAIFKPTNPPENNSAAPDQKLVSLNDLLAFQTKMFDVVNPVFRSENGCMAIDATIPEAILCTIRKERSSTLQLRWSLYSTKTPTSKDILKDTTMMSFGLIPFVPWSFSLSAESPFCVFIAWPKIQLTVILLQLGKLLPMLMAKSKNHMFACGTLLPTRAGTKTKIKPYGDD